MAKVHIAIVADESGSMRGREKGVVDGINTFVAELRDTESKDEVVASLAFFDSHLNYPKVRYKYDGVELRGVLELSAGDYSPRGMTPLNDAVLDAITKIDGRLGEGDRAMVVIVTDGFENASEVSKDTLAATVSAKESDGWEFIYLGANVDSFAEAQSIGMANASVANFSAQDDVSTSNAFRTAGLRSATYAKSARRYAGTKNLVAESVGASVQDFAPQESVLRAALDDDDDGEE